MSIVKDKGEMLRQVLLRRPTRQGHAEDVFWIDNSIAKVGKRVRDEDGVVWLVAETYSAKPFADVDLHHRTWKAFAAVLDGH
jgi:hypothetical protein